MARRNQEQDGGTDRGGMRILYVEINGNNTSLQEGLRTLVTAVSKPNQGVPNPQHRLVAGQGGGATTAVDPEPNLFTDAIDVIETEQPDQSESGQNGSNRRKRGEGEKTDRNAGIVAVPDLDFVPDGKQALKEFFAKKAPANDMEQVLVLGYYLKNTVSLDNFGPGHILSAFKHVGKRVPVDLRQTIRNMKKGKIWFNYTDINAIEVA